MLRALVAGVILLTGCGRLGFSGRDPTRDGATDGADGRAPDAVADAPMYACTGSEICEGFESGLGAWMADPMAAIDATKAHRGSHSVHVHSPAFAAGADSYQTIFETQTVSASLDPFWVRAWLWLSALPDFDNGLELLTAERPSAAGDYVFVHADSTKVYSQYDTSVMATPTLVPTGQWFCLVWKVTRDTGTAGALELSGDVSVSLFGATTDSTTSPMQYVVIGLGYSGTNVPVAQPAQDLWIDDVIVSGSAVTCAD